MSRIFFKDELEGVATFWRIDRRDGCVLGFTIPTLTFEINADEGDVSLVGIIPPLETGLAIDRPLQALAGFSDEGGPIATSLQAIDQIYPLSCDASGQTLTVRSNEIVPANPRVLPERAACQP